MRVVITGGAGFLGQSLARSLVRRGALLTHRHDGEESTAKIQSIVLADVHRPELLDGAGGVATSVAVGDVADRAFCDALVGDGAGPLSVFHLGAVMSGQGEADFDLCLATNLAGTMHMLEAARRSGAPRPRFVYASAGATLGAGAPTDWVASDGEVSDATRATPHTTYGMTKACGELLLADYSRRGFVDGRGVRLPSVVVRAGAPNAATTGVYSGVVRETLAGVDTASPIAGGVKHAVAGARSAVAADDLVREYMEDFPEALAAGVAPAPAAPPAPLVPADLPRASRFVRARRQRHRPPVAVRLAAGGWTDAAPVVVVAGRRRAPLEETAALAEAAHPGCAVVVAPADLTDPKDVERLFAELPRCDLLFNNAGVNVPPTSVEDMSLDAWRYVVGTNVAREAFRLMKGHGGGRIVNNGSVSAQTPRPGSCAYTASKHAVSGLTKSLALDGRAHGIACGQIDYGNVVSPLSAAMATGMPQADGSDRPEPRMGTDDAADAVFYMAQLPLSANVLNMTVMATNMPLVGRG
ncbi:GDP-mannose 4,6 dehydratase [Aureococcus anophagefferens]|uniref:GDP-mannose 4,6 dehydratase n=1 Tax=Aureococcus anophagefferens TaxID=44056 RepID=A0ABR1GEY8_AURAN